MTTEPRAMFVSMYRDKSLNTLRINGRPAWLAGEVAEILQFKNEGELIRKLVLDCGGNAEAHFQTLSGNIFAELVKSVQHEGDTPTWLRGRKRINTLTVMGVHALTAKNAIHPSLWNHIRNRCIPEFYSIAQEEARSDLEFNRLELEKRKFQTESLEALADALQAQGKVDPKVVLAYRVTATEIALGESLPDAMPRLNDEWLSPTQIANQNRGVSSWRVGRIIEQLGLRGDPQYSMATLGKARGHDGTVICYLYNREAVSRIEEVLRDNIKAPRKVDKKQPHPPETNSVGGCNSEPETEKRTEMETKIDVSATKSATKYIQFINSDGDAHCHRLDRIEDLASDLRCWAENEEPEPGTKIQLEVVAYTDLECKLMPDPS